MAATDGALAVSRQTKDAPLVAKLGRLSRGARVLLGGGEGAASEA